MIISKQLISIKQKIKDYNKKILRSEGFITVIALITSLIIRLLYQTLRIKKINFEELKKYSKTGYILLFWHGRFMLPPFLIKKTGMKMFGLFSKHPDGKLIAKIFAFNGVNPIWGSTHYATTSTIRDSINILKQGHVLGFTPDGPIGPRFNIVTNSPFYFAMKTEVPIIPLYISAENVKIMNSWDCCMIIKPFSKVTAKIGDPCFITNDDFKNKLNEIKNNLQNLMVLEQQKLDRMYNLPLIEPEIFEQSRAYGKLIRMGKINTERK